MALLFAIVTLAWYSIDVKRAIRMTGVEVHSPVMQKLAAGSPVDLGVLPGGDGKLYINLTFEFRALSTAYSYQDLFQTAPGNDGIRVELRGPDIAAIVGNSVASDQPVPLMLSDHLERGQWHRMTVTAIENDFVSATLDGETVRSEGKTVAIGGTAFRLGVGFDDTRKFGGEIRNARLDYAVARPLVIAELLYWSVLGSLIVALAGLIFVTFRLQLVELWHSSVDAATSDRDAQDAAPQIAVWTTAGIGTLIALAIYSAASVYFRTQADVVVSTLLPGYAQTPGGGVFKREALAFVLAQITFCGALVMFWAWRLIYRRPLSLRPSRATLFIALAVCCGGTLFLPEALMRMFCLLAGAFFVVALAVSDYRFLRVASAAAIALPTLLLRLIGYGQGRSRKMQSFLARVLLVVGTVVVASVLLLPGKDAWYPIVLPNDYYEATDRFEVGAGSTAGVDRTAVQSCLADRSTTPACKEVKELRDAFATSSYWQAATGRVLYHHSYVFIPAKHWLTHGLDNAVPYLYGYGNTMFHGLLMAAMGGTLGSYFVTYPLALVAGLLIIAGCVGYITLSRWLAAAAFLICLYELYAIDFAASFLAASFSPLRYAGLALQITSVFYCLRGPAKRIAAIPATALLSLFWNTEFGLVGLLGQGLVLFAPQLRVSVLVRGGTLFVLSAASLAFYVASRPAQDIVNSIFLGFFQVNMPVLHSWEIAESAVYVVLVQAVATFAALAFAGAERTAKLCILPVVALVLVKAIFNPSLPHMSISLAFILPMALVFLPRPALAVDAETGARWANAGKLAVITVLAVLCWNSGISYGGKAERFKQALVRPFISQAWASLGETQSIAVPEGPIAERVSAIAEISRPDDVLLLLSPFDHLLSFYANPARYCGHFELLSNIATQRTADQVVDCVARVQNALVVYDRDLLKACPDLSALGIETECNKKFMAKSNVQRIFERLLPDLVEVGRRGQLVFYRKRNT